MSIINREDTIDRLENKYVEEILYDAGIRDAVKVVKEMPSSLELPMRLSNLAYPSRTITEPKQINYRKIHRIIRELLEEDVVANNDEYIKALYVFLVLLNEEEAYRGKVRKSMEKGGDLG